MSKERTVVIFPGSFKWIYKGMNVPGLDLKKLVRDVLNECGYPCVKCNETYTANCNDSLLNPDIRELIATLQNRVTALEGATTTDGLKITTFYDTAYPVTSLTVTGATTIVNVYINGVLAEENSDYTVSGNVITFTPALTASSGSNATNVDIVVNHT